MPQSVPVVLGPSVVLSICTALWRHLPLLEQTQFDPRMSLKDDPASMYTGCDDSGASVVPLPLILKGQLIATYSDLGRAGRGLKPAIDMMPRLRPMGLKLDVGQPIKADLAILISELSGLTIQPDGIVVGVAPEATVLETGHAVKRCAGGRYRFNFAELFGQQILHAASDPMPAGSHYVPQLALAST